MDEKLTPYPDNSAFPVIIAPIIAGGKHIDNANPGARSASN